MSIFFMRNSTKKAKRTRKRGRPRTFDSETVMTSIVNSFRRKGYAATSLDDLSDATGLTRPSLYAAFGDKLAMYLAALETFTARSSEKSGSALHKGETPEAALKGFFEAMLSRYYSGAVPERGCLVFGTAPGACDNKAVRDFLLDTIGEADKLMTAKFLELLGNQETHTTRAAAEAATHTLVGISMRVRSGAPQREVREIAKRASALIASSLDKNG